MNGLALMTDYSCNKFRFDVEENLFHHRILNDSTFFFFFLQIEILLKMFRNAEKSWLIPHREKNTLIFVNYRAFFRQKCI